MRKRVLLPRHTPECEQNHKLFIIISVFRRHNKQFQSNCQSSNTRCLIEIHRIRRLPDAHAPRASIFLALRLWMLPINSYSCFFLPPHFKRKQNCVIVSFECKSNSFGLLVFRWREKGRIWIFETEIEIPANGFFHIG